MRGANETGVHWNVVIEWVSGRMLRYIGYICYVSSGLREVNVKTIRCSRLLTKK